MFYRYCSKSRLSVAQRRAASRVMRPSAARRARSLCAEVHKPWPNAADGVLQRGDHLAADVAVGHRHSNRVAGQDARVMTKRHGYPSATPICK